VTEHDCGDHRSPTFRRTIGMKAPTRMDQHLPQHASSDGQVPKVMAPVAVLRARTGEPLRRCRASKVNDVPVTVKLYKSADKIRPHLKVFLDASRTYPKIDNICLFRVGDD
jgi:hypothetical protein